MQLSGGQRQWLCLARAVLRDPAIQAALARLRVGRTCVCVAHRLSTVRDAHEIVVLASGVVAERGTHEQLARMPGGKYAALVAVRKQPAGGGGR